MVPSWLTAVSSFSPFLLLISVAVAAFGFYRLREHLRAAREEEQEEELKRKEFLAKMSSKIPNAQRAH